MIAAANDTSRSIVVVLFGPVIAGWAAVEGMTLLPSKGSGFGKGYVLGCTLLFVLLLQLDLDHHSILRITRNMVYY